MGEIVNLRRSRKAQDRRREEARAAENRILFGMTKAERLVVEIERAKADRNLEAHKITPAQDPASR